MFSFPTKYTHIFPNCAGYFLAELYHMDDKTCDRGGTSTQPAFGGAAASAATPGFQFGQGQGFLVTLAVPQTASDQ